MPYYRKKIIAGDVIEIKDYFSPRAAGENIERGPKQKVSSENQEKQNLKNAQRKLSQLINANFIKGDLFITLTHSKKIDEDEAKRELNNYLRRIRTYRKKEKLEDLKYIAVTETQSKVHHHLIMSSMDFKVAIEKWKLGRVMISILEPGGDYTGLAHYITKEDAKEELEGRQKKRWSQSRNLKKPTIIRKEIKRIRQMHNPPKGYRIAEQSISFSEAIGKVQYIKLIRVGGYDYGYGRQDE